MTDALEQAADATTTPLSAAVETQPTREAEPVQAAQEQPEAVAPAEQTREAELEQGVEVARANMNRAVSIRDGLVTAKSDAEAKVAYFTKRAAEAAYAAVMGDDDASKALASAKKSLAAVQDAAENAGLALPGAEAAAAAAQVDLGVAQHALARELHRLTCADDDDARKDMDDAQDRFVKAIRRVRESSRKAGRSLGHTLRQFDMLPFIHPDVAEAAHSNLPHLCVGRKMADAPK